ncbi:MAG: hypothetical protein WA728_06515 [Xanthobacteraceae bacterium]
MSEADQTTEQGWPVFELWQKYEDVAMHFNDLLIRLRTQALGAVAALTTIIGVFAKAGEDRHTSWEMVAFAFAILFVFWLAIWIIDFCYYNRLLKGAVAALLDVEEQSKTKLRLQPIDMSTKIEAAVAGRLKREPQEPTQWQLGRGSWFFYGLVGLTLLGGFAFSLCQALTST